jgi:hypothetical protein
MLKRLAYYGTINLLLLATSGPSLAQNSGAEIGKPLQHW